MDSNYIKTQVMSWLRFQNAWHLIATEVPTNRTDADILAFKDGKFLEVEVKTSASDFRRDFKKVASKSWKKGATLKHGIMEEKRPNLFAPHYFYFAVPSTLRESSLDILAQHPESHKYGLILVQTGENPILVERVARNLRPEDTREFAKVQRAIMLRMGSQLVCLMQKAYLNS